MSWTSRLSTEFTVALPTRPPLPNGLHAALVEATSTIRKRTPFLTSEAVHGTPIIAAVESVTLVAVRRQEPRTALALAAQPIHHLTARHLAGHITKVCKMWAGPETTTLNVTKEFSTRRALHELWLFILPKTVPASRTLWLAA